MDGHKIITLQDFNKVVHTVREANKLSIVFKKSIIDKIVIHLQQDVLILYNDQLDIVATYIAEIKYSLAKREARHQKYLAAITPSIAKIKSAKMKAKLTGRILKVQEDWLL